MRYVSIKELSFLPANEGLMSKQNTICLLFMFSDWLNMTFSRQYSNIVVFFFS